MYVLSKVYGYTERYGLYTYQLQLASYIEKPEYLYDSISELKEDLDSKGLKEFDAELNIVEQIDSKEQLLAFAKDNDLKVDSRLGVVNLKALINSLMEAL